MLSELQVRCPRLCSDLVTGLCLREEQGHPGNLLLLCSRLVFSILSVDYLLLLTGQPQKQLLGEQGTATEWASCACAHRSVCSCGSVRLCVNVSSSVSLSFYVCVGVKVCACVS